jgi:hypothetical protein
LSWLSAFIVETIVTTAGLSASTIEANEPALLLMAALAGAAKALEASYARGMEAVPAMIAALRRAAVL